MYSLVVVFCYWVPEFFDAHQQHVKCEEKPVMTFPSSWGANESATSCAIYMRNSFKISNDSAYAYCKPPISKVER